MSHFVFWCNLTGEDSGPTNHSIDFLKCLIESKEIDTLTVFARTSIVSEALNKNYKIDIVSYFLKGGRGLVISSLLYQLRSLFYLVKLLKNSDSTIVYFRHTPLLLLPIFLKLFRYNNIYVEVNGIPNQFLLERKKYELRHYLRKKLLFELDKILFRVVDGIFTVCEVFKKNIKERYGDRTIIKVIPNGSFSHSVKSIQRDKAKKECQLKHDKKYAIYVGNIVSKFEGVVFLIEAFLKICEKEELKDWYLLILGKEPIENNLKALIPPEFSDRIQFRGVVDREKMYKFIAASNIGVYTPPTIKYGIDGQRGGSALKLVDYLSTGCPILVPRSKYYDYVDEFKCGFRYKPEDVSSFIKQFKRLGNNDIINSQYGINARHYAINYLDWSKTLKPVIELIKKIKY
jgi:glycosyltransferase involved in cell wall biosynthesis